MRIKIEKLLKILIKNCSNLMMSKKNNNLNNINQNTKYIFIYI